jgi:hypothetical protein
VLFSGAACGSTIHRTNSFEGEKGMAKRHQSPTALNLAASASRRIFLGNLGGAAAFGMTMNAVELSSLPSAPRNLARNRLCLSCGYRKTQRRSFSTEKK